MDMKQFLTEFGHIANAPGGVEQLRELVLRLAVTGDLISTDTPLDASPLLDVIEKQKRKHPDQKKVIAKQAPISRAEIKAPPHWAVCRIGDLALTITGGGTPSKNHPTYWDGPIPWASVKDLKALKFIDGTADHITEEGLKNSSSNLIPPGRIIVCTRMGLGKVAINRISLAINQDLKALELPEEVNIDFFLILYKTREVKGTGTTVSGIKQNQLLALPAVLPPLEEQALIVSKVDELMALCDKLETQQQTRYKLQNALRQSTLQAVASATRPHELQTTWARLAGNFGLLFHTSEDVAAFKGLILDLAVSGALLTSEKHHASTGVDLINAIADARIKWSKLAIDQEKKEALAALKKLRMQQLSPPDKQLPKHWTWASLLEVSKVIIDCDHKTPTYTDSGVHLIRTTDIRNGEMRFDATKKVSWESYLSRSRRLTPQVGDIFFTREAPMGEAAIVPNGHVVCLGQRLMLIRLFPELFNNKFLIYVIQSPGFQKRLRVAAIGMTVKHINVVDVENLVVPVPPKAEQDRIVAIVDVLFRMCDHYAEQLSRKQRIATNLASSAVASLTGIAIEQEEEPMKAPQTELIAPLRLGTTPDIKAQAPLATILARHNGEMSAKDLWQRFSGEIDAFYAQLKTEVAHGWILEPAPAEVREKLADTASS
ncbi:TPA: restriction endonuclease subunit S [Aeromonas veronii]|uniref:restriction endonuclease subunit S n=1 Tax=Aeromonas veronii TaxID=654 RepID=UPI003309769E|nr:restriction endonuclease subunit S [Aeromonas veronii]HDO1335313.1 restriction endonuclease subunit S [Aeromonas veronii]HDO1338499.1 restriction endonuclease subunit S [Aeromonas veronii]HDO1343610.1 restriction endonuclease subunit S [Aeromonas veronii]HDO1348231.1 restriction endonuclease subunit S [Aeromonas veronii]